MPRKKKGGQESQPANTQVDDNLAQQGPEDLPSAGSGHRPAEEQPRDEVAEQEPENVPPEAPSPPAPAEEREPRPIEVQVGKLREALVLVGPAVPHKSALPVTLNVRLGDGRVMATDLEVAVAVQVPGEGGPVLLPHKGALEFLKYAPGHETARITRQKGVVNIAAGEQSASFQTPDAAEFPPIPEEGGDSEGVLDGEALVRALTAVQPCAATEQDRPVLTGVYLATGEAVEVCGADGFRLAWEPVLGKLVGPSMIIPAGAVRALEHLWKRAAVPDLSGATDPARVALAKRLIRLDWGDKRLRLRFGVVTIMVQLIQGTFPNYRQLIPTETTSSVTVAAEEMERALRQVNRVARDGSGIIRLQWEGNTVRVSARAEEVGETVVPVPANSTGPGKVGLNLRYLLDYFGGREGSVTISLTGQDGAPVRFAHRGRPHVIIMPMSVKD